MFEKYTEKARRVIFFARYAVSELGSTAIEPEHLLLGLLREDSSLISRFLSPPGTSIDSICRQIEEHTTTGEKIPLAADVPLSNRSENVLKTASEEAEHMSHYHVGTEHLLLGLVQEEKSLAAMVLSAIGIKPSVIRKELEKPK
jgi:ATP-dependent Clp protease ATP-binding subunit ClpC